MQNFCVDGPLGNGAQKLASGHPVPGDAVRGHARSTVAHVGGVRTARPPSGAQLPPVGIDPEAMSPPTEHTPLSTHVFGGNETPPPAAPGHGVLQLLSVKRLRVALEHVLPVGAPHVHGVQLMVNWMPRWPLMGVPPYGAAHAGSGVVAFPS